MDEKTKEALEGSIKKYKRIVKSTKAHDDGGINCTLCKLFLRFNCDGCPIFDATGTRGCEQSPWISWRNHGSTKHNQYQSHYRVPYCKECIKLARKELDFLISLRKEN